MVLLQVGRNKQKVAHECATSRKIYEKMGKPYKDLPMVGVSGFEPEASWTRTKRDTKLRHTPKANIL